MKTIKELTRLSNGKELGIQYPIKLYDQDGNTVYCESFDGYWYKSEYKDGKEVCHETSTGYWCRSEYQDGKEVYYGDSTGYWWKREYQGGEMVYFENSNGDIEDSRKSVDMTVEEVCKLVGKKVRIVE